MPEETSSQPTNLSIWPSSTSALTTPVLSSKSSASLPSSPPLAILPRVSLPHGLDVQLFPRPRKNTVFEEFAPTTAQIDASERLCRIYDYRWYAPTAPPLDIQYVRQPTLTMSCTTTTTTSEFLNQPKDADNAANAANSTNTNTSDTSYTADDAGAVDEVGDAGVAKTTDNASAAGVANAAATETTNNPPSFSKKKQDDDDDYDDDSHDDDDDGNEFISNDSGNESGTNARPKFFYQPAARFESRQVDFAICVGELGSGKTFLVAQTMRNLGPDYCTIVVCSKIIADGTYRELCLRYGIPFWGTLNYESFQVGMLVKNCNPPLRLDLIENGYEYTGETMLLGRGLFYRDKYQKRSSNNALLKEYVFRPTRGAKELFSPKRKFLVIFDEFHNFKNINTSRWFGIKAFIHQLVRVHADSRMIFMSATPFDKGEQIANFLRLIGVIQHRYLCGKCHTLGWTDVVTFCRYITHEKTEAFLQEHSKKNICYLKPAEQYLLVYRLFLATLRDTLLIPLCRENNEALESRHEYIRHHYAITRPRDVVLLREGMNCLESASMSIAMERKKPSGNMLDHFQSLIFACKKIECSKLYCVAQHIRAILRAPCRRSCPKVIVAMNFITDHVDMMMDWLLDFSPLELSARIGREERKKAIEMFNAPDSAFRILFLSVSLGAEGISLHDTHGDFPRTMFLFPSFHFTDMIQTMGRIIRHGMLSPSRILCVCAETAKSEIIFLNNIQKKQNIQSSIADSLNGRKSAFETILDWKTTKQTLDGSADEMVEDAELGESIKTQVHNRAQRQNRKRRYSDTTLDQDDDLAQPVFAVPPFSSSSNTNTNTNADKDTGHSNKRPTPNSRSFSSSFSGPIPTLSTSTSTTTSTVSSSLSSSLILGFPGIGSLSIPFEGEESVFFF